MGLRLRIGRKRKVVRLKRGHSASSASRCFRLIVGIFQSSLVLYCDRVATFVASQFGELRIDQEIACPARFSSLGKICNSTTNINLRKI